MPLLAPPPHRDTTPGGNREHVALALSTRGRRGGPFGGPVTPSRLGPGSRRSVARVETCVLVFLLVFSAVLGMVVEGARGAPVRTATGVTDFTLSVDLSFLNGSTNATVPVSQAEGAVLFLGTQFQPYDNLTLQNGSNYTSSDFPGVDLSNLSTVLVDVYAPAGCPCSDAQVEFDNLSGDPTLPLDVVFHENGTTVGLPLPPVDGGDAPFPAFLQLVGVGVAVALTYLVIQGLRKLARPLGIES